MRKEYKEDAIKEDAIEQEAIIKEEPKKDVKPINVIITVDNLALRDEPNGNKIGIAPAGYTTVKQVIDSEDSQWGELADGTGYINMNWTRKAD